MRLRPALFSSMPWLALAATTVPASSALALDPFTDGSSVLNNAQLTSGVAIAIADMNADGLDDIIRLDETQSLEIEWQQEDGSYVRYDFGDTGGYAWGIAIGDVDRNGYPDIFTGGGYDGLKLITANDDGTDFDLGFLNGPDIFVQCASFADIDNNGSLDMLICHDDGISSPYNNDGTGNLAYDPNLIVAASQDPTDDDSGNYGIVWSDYDNDGDLDLYIAKCRLGINNPTDGRRLNILYQNDGSGNYTEVAQAAGLQPQAQSWAFDFADIDNDGDLDGFLINHDMQSDLYENLGPAQLGKFADITPDSGMGADLNSMGLGIQAHFEDFDNDTFIDLLVTGRSGQHRLFMNDGDKTFTSADQPFPTGGIGIQSAVIGDLDDDGFPDVLAGFATGFNEPSSNPDKVFLNPGNENNWINVRLTGVESNPTAVGARVEVTGEWGTQIREVRAGEGYGINNTATRHFGIGTAEAIESITVRWPSGHVDTGMDPPINGTVHITEGCPDTFYPDTDGDGYGDAANPTTGCFASVGLVADDTDCDDADGNNFPDNAEVCDGSDNDCDGEVDEDVDGGCEAGTSSGGADETSGGMVGTSDEHTTGTPPTTDPTNATDGGTGDTDSMQSGDSGGCGCVASDTGRAPWLSFGLFGLVGLFGAIRRR